jgi:hypothetical protein
MQTKKRRAKENGNTSLGWEDKAWIDRELDGAYFQDVRLGKRLRTLLGLMSNGLGQTIPLACQDWANTKAAYRFFSNPRITQLAILFASRNSTQSSFGFGRPASRKAFREAAIRSSILTQGWLLKKT